LVNKILLAMIQITNTHSKCKDKSIKGLQVHMFKEDFIKEFLKEEIFH